MSWKDKGRFPLEHQLCLQCFSYLSPSQQPKSNFSVPSSINQDLLLLQKGVRISLLQEDILQNSGHIS